jgi:hypothetical protein
MYKYVDRQNTMNNLELLLIYLSLSLWSIMGLHHPPYAHHHSSGLHNQHSQQNQHVQGSVSKSHQSKPQSLSPPPESKSNSQKPLFTLDDLVKKYKFPPGGYFHAYNPSIRMTGTNSSNEKRDDKCSKYFEDHKNMDFSSMVKNYQLWSGLVGEERMKALMPNDTIYGLKYALDTIWKHQHPTDCKTAKFLIPTKHNGGFGSELHVLANPLGLAMDLGRVYLPNPFLNEGSEWEFDNDFCRNQTEYRRFGFDCYYESWSSCTIFDALGDDALSLLKKWKTNKYHSIPIPMIQIEKADIEYIYSDRFLKHVSRIAGAKKAAMVHMMHRLGGKYIPRVLKEVVECSPMLPKFQYYWWRAMTMAYVMRPNAATRQWIEQHRLPALEEAIALNNTAAIYVRRGDKDSEMRLSPIEEYIDGFQYLWTMGYINSDKSKTPRHIFVASESSTVVEQMKSWQAKHSDLYRIHFTEIFDRKGLFAEKTRAERKEGVTVVHHPEEYLSMLLNIHYLIQASGWVCTMSSNFCRVIDELRATVGGRAGQAFMDLSIEKCTHPPCLYGGFFDLDW